MLKKKSNFAVMTVPADGLAPLGARPSAGTVMTKFKLVHVYRTNTQWVNILEWGHNRGKTGSLVMNPENRQ